MLQAQILAPAKKMKNDELLLKALSKTKTSIRM